MVRGEEEKKPDGQSGHYDLHQFRAASISCLLDATYKTLATVSINPGFWMDNKKVVLDLSVAPSDLGAKFQ